MFMLCARDEDKKAYIAIITDKNPFSLKPDEQIIVLADELLPTRGDCERWFDRMRKERPWEARR